MAGMFKEIGRQFVFVEQGYSQIQTIGTVGHLYESHVQNPATLVVVGDFNSLGAALFWFLHGDEHANGRAFLTIEFFRSKCRELQAIGLPESFESLMKIGQGN